MTTAIVLGGGRSSRMGTDKLALALEGEPLLARTCAAAAAVADRVIVAGHQRPGLAVDFVAEDPPFGGPVAGIVAALGSIPDGDVVILAGDLANPRGVVELLATQTLGPDGVVLVDEQGWPQYLAGRYRLSSLRREASSHADVRDLSVRRFMSGLALATVPAPVRITADVDTPEQYAQADRAIYDTP